MENYKVLITTSGIGSRLGELTKYTNKSLVRVAEKPTLSYIVESYPKEVPLVITIGYFGNQVKDFVELAYPERKVEFVEVDNYDGPGSSLGYSMLQAKEKLQCPFIFHAGDTITDSKVDKILEPSKNWIAGHKSKDASRYRTLNVSGEKLFNINDKGAADFDYVHIGLVGIRDYEEFWKFLEKIYQKNKLNSALNDTDVINAMIRKNNSEFYFFPFQSWFDIGNMSALQKTKNSFKKKNSNLTILDKFDESIFIFNDFVIKFFYNKKNVEERFARSKILKGLVPKMEASKGNFYRYKYVKGNIYSEIVTPSDFASFLNWSENSLWKNSAEVESSKFKEICRNFYYQKTLDRVKKLISLENIKNKEDIINGEKTPSLMEILDRIDFEWLSDADQFCFHGDFILDNIVKTESGYCLLDWRQNFGGLLQSGDKCYDLAKLNHSLTVNHDIVNQNLFSIEIGAKGEIKCDIFRKENLVNCQEVFHKFVKQQGYDLKKIKVLTALIWLNMSPLHPHPFNLFLYYFGKLNLWRIVREK